MKRNIHVDISGTTYDFGAGRYSAVMAECANRIAQWFELDAWQAIRIAIAIGADIGRANFTGAVRVGKPSKDGTVALRDVSVAKGQAYSRPLAVLRTIQAIENVPHLDFGTIICRANGPIYEYMTEMSSAPLETGKSIPETEEVSA